MKNSKNKVTNLAGIRFGFLTPTEDYEVRQPPTDDCKIRQSKEIRDYEIRQSKTKPTNEYEIKPSKTKTEQPTEEYEIRNSTDNYKIKQSQPRTYWKCICDCGNIHWVTVTNLRSGRVKSCGKCNLISSGRKKINSTLKGLYKTPILKDSTHKYSEKEIRNVYDRLKAGDFPREVSYDTGVPLSYVRRIGYGESRIKLKPVLRKKSPSRPRKNSWKLSEVHFLQENYFNMTYKEIGEHLGRTEEAVRNKVGKLNFNKSEFISL